jgi:ABC-2 type transport system ATP-binding protein
MSQVEELCDRILLIDHGQVVLYGPLDQIKSQHAQHAVEVECDGLPPDLPGVAHVEQHNSTFHLVLEQDASAQTVLQEFVKAGVSVKRFQVASPPLEDIFISVVNQ